MGPRPRVGASIGLTAQEKRARIARSGPFLLFPSPDLAELVRIQPFAHFLARLEIGNPLGRYVHRIPRARIPTHTGIALPRGECSKSAKFNPATFCQSLGYFIEEDIDDLFDFLRSQIGIVGCQ